MNFEVILFYPFTRSFNLMYWSEESKPRIFFAFGKLRQLKVGLPQSREYDQHNPDMFSPIRFEQLARRRQPFVLTAVRTSYPTNFLDNHWLNMKMFMLSK
jgi:hypothetical protein